MNFKRLKSKRTLDRRQLKNDKTLRSASYYRSGKTLSQRRAAASSSTPSVRELSAHRRKVASTFLIVIVVCLLLTGLVWQLIVSLEFLASGASVNNHDCYQHAARDYFDKRPIERLKIFLNQDGLLANLQSHCPEVDTINNLQIGFLRPTTVTISFKEPVAMWILGETKYYVDKRGAAFKVNHFDEPRIKVLDKSGLDPSKVPTVASSQLLGFIGQVVALSTDKQLTVESVVIPPLATRQIEVLYEKYPFPIKMLTSGSAPRQVEDASRVLSYLDAQGIVPAYVDVRISRQAYYQ